MSGKTRPSQRTKVLLSVDYSNLSYTEKQFIHEMFTLAEKQQEENERLNNELHSKVEYIHEQLEIIESKKAEIKRLQYQVYRLKKYDEKRDIELHSRLIASSRIEAIKEFAKKIDDEIYEALTNNENVIREREIKYNVNRFDDIFCSSCMGKNTALCGIHDFITELVKEKVGADNG